MTIPTLISENNMPHSDVFKQNGLIKEHKRTDNKLEQRLDANEMFCWLASQELPDLQANGDSAYDQMSDLLREANDAQFNIVSSLNDHNEWVRDATHATPLEQRIPHDSAVIDGNNALLRCLSRLRPIDYAIGKKLEGNPEKSNSIRQELKDKFELLTANILTTVQKDDLTEEKKQTAIKKLEKEFNTELVQHLHEANLTKGCENEKDAEKLLFHYRNLSSLMAPSRTMVTLTYDATTKTDDPMAKVGIIQRETQYPVVKKTDKQLEDIKVLSKIQPHPFSAEKNGHNSSNIAHQEADSIFVELMSKNDRAMAAQARKTHAVGGAKNAFIVKNEIMVLDEAGLPEDGTTVDIQPLDGDTLWLARTGVPVPVVKGEKKEAVQEHTRENIDQIRETAKEYMHQDELDIHITCLNTYMHAESQIQMIDNLYEATRKRKGDRNDNISYMPTNLVGTAAMLDVASDLFEDSPEQAPKGIAPTQKADRLDSVSRVVLKAADKKGTLSVVQCASGQDRTGTAIEKSTQDWLAERYTEKKLDTSNIETMRALGGNAAEITSHHIHGSRGMKTDSKATNFLGRGAFSEEVSDQFYLASAKTNKKNTVGDVEFLKKPSSSAIEEYKANMKMFRANLEIFQKTMGDDKNKQKLFETGARLYNEARKLVGANPKQADAETLSDINTTIPHCNTILKNPNLKNPEVQESMRRLAALSNNVSGKSSPAWKAFGIGLLTFACAACVVAGALLAIPTGGSSLLIGGLAAAGIAGIVVGATTVGLAREYGLAKSISQYRSALHDIKPNEEPNPDRVSDPTHSLH